MPGCPIRESPDQSLLAAPRSLTQLATPFIASRCQGIHHAPLVTWRFQTSTTCRKHIQGTKNTTNHEKTQYASHDHHQYGSQLHARHYLPGPSPPPYTPSPTKRTKHRQEPKPSLVFHIDSPSTQIARHREHTTTHSQRSGEERWFRPSIPRGLPVAHRRREEEHLQGAFRGQAGKLSVMLFFSAPPPPVNPTPLRGAGVKARDRGGSTGKMHLLQK